MDLGTYIAESVSADKVSHIDEQPGIGGSIGELGGDHLVGDSHLLFFNKAANLVEVLEPGVSLYISSGLGLIGNSKLVMGNSIGIGMEGKGDILSPQTILGGTTSRDAGISERLQATSGLSEEEKHFVILYLHKGRF